MTENFYRIDDDPNRGMPLKEIPECNPETHVWSSVTDSYRFFIKPSEKYESFEAYLLKWVVGSSEEDLWEESVEVEVVFRALALYDGVRHVNYHPSDDGYGSDHPSVVMACAFRMLSQFESVLCSMYEEDDY